MLKNLNDYLSLGMILFMFIYGTKCIVGAFFPKNKSKEIIHYYKYLVNYSENEDE